MKRTLIITLIFLACSLAASAQANSPRRLAHKVEIAYLYGLGELDGKGLINGRLRVLVEDSISEEIERHNFRSFAEMEHWLKKEQRPDGTPARATGDLGSCNKTRCIIEYNNGILHNHLYLKKITFGYRNGRRYIREIRLLDGA